ncbi:tRNA (guanine9-N1)-methyltransferase [Nematocida displodere]|uniref:tRNA (guanine(9)-N1)-methyltransferase n=1 Tax=Nematocida displodere TaxID=1805483 RepID=A0A177EH02_9MICR|nr:tRNA (guanine9-N1)-methyltransferase [Nematocida displodere]
MDNPPAPRLSKQEKRALKFQKLKEKYKLKPKKRSKKKREPENQPEPRFKVGIEIIGGEELMSEKEMKSLELQIRHSYGANRISSNPVHLFITNTSLLSMYLPKESVSWKNVTQTSDSVANHQGPVVVLTADSENLLEDLDENTLYVIGGLVDRNRHKGYTHNLFKDKFPTARLPISQALKSSAVLNTLHVFNILLSYIEEKNWATAIAKHIPGRKQFTDSDHPTTQASSEP